MLCVNPPLSAKPSRGYGWTCAPCSRRHEDQVDSGEVQHQAHATRDSTPKNSSASSAVQQNAKPTRGRGRPRKEKPGAVNSSNDEEMPIKHYRMWPFRYFG